MKTTKVKIVQIESSKSLTALDSAGNCWTFLGNAFGWAPMNMTKLSIEEASEIRERKRNSGREFQGDWRDGDTL